MLVDFSLPLIGCQYFRIKSIVVNDDDPVAVFLVRRLSFHLIEFSIEIRECFLHVKCVRKDDHQSPSSLIA